MRSVPKTRVRRRSSSLRVSLALVLTGVVTMGLATPANADLVSYNVPQDSAAALATLTTMDFPVRGDRTRYVLGDSAPVGAVVSVVDSTAAGGEEVPQGTVEFFDGIDSLGTALTDENGHAALDTAAWPAAGARSVTATFTPQQANVWAASTSEAQIYRLVDLSRMVADIEVSEPIADVNDASLDWTIANIWFSNFSVGFEREVVRGPISLEEMQPGATIEEKQRYYFRPFTFSEGTGTKDIEGNRVVHFSGTARLTSGSGNRWDFSDPILVIGANGDGYLTAEFSGFYDIGARQDYVPQRVTIATFSGAQIEVNAQGRAEATIVLNWEGQAGAPGAWAASFDSSFPNEFVALLNPAINLFFASSGVATDASKRPHDLRLSFTEREREDLGGSDSTASADAEGGSGADGNATVDEGASSGAADGLSSNTTGTTERADGQRVLADTGDDQGWQTPVLSLGLCIAAVGILILTRRRLSMRE